LFQFLIDLSGGFVRAILRVFKALADLLTQIVQDNTVAFYRRERDYLSVTDA
jgi:hypothetical protein